MTTECTTERLEFERFRRQRVVGRFDGGELGSDGGGLLLRELAQRTGLFGRLSACFRDYREPQRTRHPVEVLVAARVLGLALGYEDCDHDTLRQSKLWSLLCGAVGRGRRRASWEALPPGKSTLAGADGAGAGRRGTLKIVADTARLDALLVEFLDWHGEQPERIVLDPLHGRQEGRFFHGYYRSYCYLPLYIFWASSCWGRACGRRTGTRRMARWRSWSASWGGSGSAGPGSRSGCARALRGGVLRAGRYGEPHQGTAAGAVRRSHLGADDAGQPVAPVFRLVRLRAAGVTAALGPVGHAAGAGAMRHDPPEAAQDRRADPGQRAGRAAVVRRGLPGSGPLRAGVGPSPEPAPALLAAALQPSSRAPSEVAGDQCVCRAGCKRKQAPTTADLATLTRHLPGSDAPRNIARLSIHPKWTKRLRI